MSSIDVFRPVKIFSYYFAFAGVSGIVIHVLLRNHDQYTIEFMNFVIIISIVHLLIAIGIFFKKKWGYFLFKLYLYLLYIAPPIGTYIAIKTFRYIKYQRVERFFH